uniref:Phospholipase A2 n=1 Tax=Crocodylus porosus TaxID=8502 RepID=A0A7M4FNC6_CROPO
WGEGLGRVPPLHWYHGALGTISPPPTSSNCYLAAPLATDCYVTLWLPTSSKEEAKTKTILNSSEPEWNETFCFRIQAQVKNILELRVYDEDPLTRDDLLFTVLFDVAEVRLRERASSIVCRFSLKLSLLDSVLASVHRWVSVCASQENLDMRLGFDLCSQEKDFLQKRKKVVAAALKEILHLEENLQDHEVPVVAIMATGGGARAMTSLYGQLSGLKKLNLLDCITYIGGTSGSTWTMSSLYEDASWSQKDLERPINEAQKHVTKSKTNTFSLEHVVHYQRQLSQRAKEGFSISFNDLWAVALEYILHGKVNDFKLSDQQQAVSQGQNPLPLYLALNVKENHMSTANFKEWCEFSPFEVGFPKYGAFIRSEDFGSEFFMGQLMKKNPESRICYLEGLWSNIFAVNLLDIWNAFGSSDKFWQQHVQAKIKNIEEKHALSKSSSYLGTSWINPAGMLSKIIKDILTDRPLHHHVHNFLRGLQLHKDYYQQSPFSIWKDSQLDVFPNQLTPSEDDLCLVDAAYFINTSCPPLLRKERNVNIILSFDYSLNTAFEVIDQTGQYCSEQGIPFPKIVLSEEEKKHPKECYVFMDEENLKTPIVLHFPLVNNTFRKFKVPGVERSPAELAEGTVPLAGCCSPYNLLNMTYCKEDFDKLLKLTDYNVQNNRDLILQAFRESISRKKCCSN